jgi:hypothetical protein
MKLLGPYRPLRRWAKTNENQRIMHELHAAYALRRGEPMLGGPLKESALDLSGVCMAVDGVVG